MGVRSASSREMKEGVGEERILPHISCAPSAFVSRRPTCSCKTNKFFLQHGSFSLRFICRSVRLGALDPSTHIRARFNISCQTVKQTATAASFNSPPFFLPPLFIPQLCVLTNHCGCSVRVTPSPEFCLQVVVTLRPASREGSSRTSPSEHEAADDQNLLNH